MLDWGFGLGQQPFINANCPVWNCVVTNDKASAPASTFDAILFHMRNMNQGKVPNQRLRDPNQRYVMFLMESPVHDNFPYDKFKGFFNWTMTYRLDSTIPHPYGWFRNKVINGTRPFSYQPSLSELSDKDYWHEFDPEEFSSGLPNRPESFKNLAKRSTKVAWIVSNCHTSSKRENYVKKLKKHVTVDVYGACGAKCGSECVQKVIDNYKFYLSFENSFCEGYVTEKFYSRLQQDLLPIVMGQADYNSLAPPHSHLNVKDFDRRVHDKKTTRRRENENSTHF